MLRKLREARYQRDDEAGFTLIELLVVVIIIGILAAIAIPVFLNQREKAYQKAAESDARNAAIEVESYFVDNDEYPTDTTGETTSWDIDGDGTADVQLSDSVTLNYDNLDDGTYCIETLHSQLTEWVYYDSGAGGIIDGEC